MSPNIFTGPRGYDLGIFRAPFFCQPDHQFESQGPQHISSSFQVNLSSPLSSLHSEGNFSEILFPRSFGKEHPPPLLAPEPAEQLTGAFASAWWQLPKWQRLQEPKPFGPGDGSQSCSLSSPRTVCPVFPTSMS